MISRAQPDSSDITIGVISDTHGLLRPEAIAALQGSSFIIHAGDIGKPEVLSRLEDLAPVIAVRGNNDRGPWATSIPETQFTSVGAHEFLVIHDINQLDLDALHTTYTVVISGHSHKPTITEQNGILFLNPGSSGPRRFTLPVTMARLNIQGPRLSHEIIHLTTSLHTHTSSLT